MMLYQSLYKVASDVSSDITKGEAGTDTTLFDKAQTGVIAAIGSTDIVVADNSVSDETINITYVLSTSLGNSNTITEYELNNGSIAYTRIRRAPLAKTDEIELNIIHTIEFQTLVD